MKWQFSFALLRFFFLGVSSRLVGPEVVVFSCRRAIIEQQRTPEVVVSI